MYDKSICYEHPLFDKPQLPTAILKKTTRANLVSTALVEWQMILGKASAEVQEAAASIKKPTNQQACLPAI